LPFRTEPRLLAGALSAALQRPFDPPLGGDTDIGGILQLPDTPPLAAAVLMPIVMRAAPGLILTTRTLHMRSHAGQVAFPGGRVDATDADHVAAALREAQEEIGLPPEQVQVLGATDPYRTRSGYQIQPVVGLIPPDLPLTPNPDEVADLFEVPLAFALDPANHQRHETLREGRMRRYYVIEWQGRTIWGATAGMLVNLSARMHA